MLSKNKVQAKTGRSKATQRHRHRAWLKGIIKHTLWLDMKGIENAMRKWHSLQLLLSKAYQINREACSVYCWAMLWPPGISYMFVLSVGRVTRWAIIVSSRHSPFACHIASKINVIRSSVVLSIQHMPSLHISIHTSRVPYHFAFAIAFKCN